MNSCDVGVNFISSVCYFVRSGCEAWRWTHAMEAGIVLLSFMAGVLSLSETRLT